MEKKGHDLKVYFKTKVQDNGDPYFTGQSFMMNTAKKEDIASIVLQHIQDKAIALPLIEELQSYIVPTGSQIRLSGKPVFFRQCVGEEDFKTFQRGCNKMARSSMTIKDKNTNEDKEGPIAMFSLYLYHNHPTQDQ